MGKDFRELENVTEIQIANKSKCGRKIVDFSGYHWLMERMRPGQGVEEGIHLLNNEHSGNNFSWNTAHVPGDVYTDLYHAGELENPIYGRNMAKAKWVQDYEWWYNYAFNVPIDMIGKQITLLFEGVDYSCDVWLNTIYLGRHEGMMSPFKFDITDIVSNDQPHAPANLISIKLDPPPKNQKNIAGMKHNFAGDYLTGLIPFGIWQPVKLIATDKIFIDDYRLETTIKDKDAHITVDVDVNGFNDIPLNSKLIVSLNDGDNNNEVSSDIVIQPGQNKFQVTMDIDNAKLWWPYELGDPFLYDISIKIEEDSIALDEINERVGLREITMEHNPGFTEEESEIPWTFVINGKPMFLRSACWGGQPSFFYGRNSRERYKSYIEKARECNINNFRIFGWHPAETKDFYDLCDEMGITVWTNFAFATQVFREDKEYIDKVKHEVAEIVKVRRNHPSTIMWMGGEEVFFTEAHVKSGNRKLMEIVGDVTRGLTNVPYADASPLSSKEGIRMGYKTKESIHANAHYYAAGAIFMEDFYPNLDYCVIPELTAASAPNVESLKKFIPKDELWPMGLNWGYHAGDIDVLKTLNYEVFGDTRMNSLEDFVEGTQIAQGTILQFALEHFRRCKPHISAVSLCHFITNWPIIKWDIVDYYGVKKRSFDYVKRSYNPILPSLKFEKRRYMTGEIFNASVWVINDYYRKYNNCTLYYEIIDENGNKALSGDMIINVGENSSEEYIPISWAVEGTVGKGFKVNISLNDEDGKVISDNSYDLLIADQEASKKRAMEIYAEGREMREKFGRGYYRYAPDCVDNI